MKIQSGWAASSLVLALTLAAPVASAGRDKHRAARTDQLTSRIDYEFVGHHGEKDGEGRLLVWNATIEGDLNGTMKWWFGPQPAPDISYVGGQVGYYVARWEIWDAEGERLLLAGESAGKTVSPVTADEEVLDGMWDGHGVVTEGRGKLKRLVGRPIYETGPVIWEFPFSGTGVFSIH